MHHPLFVVLSDDTEYCRTKLVPLLPKNCCVVLDTLSAEEDMAVLHLMDGVIISSGTFSWWSAYGGRAAVVIYFKNWIRQGSVLSSLYNETDYFPPWWLGITT